jgi:hypothetical protein
MILELLDDLNWAAVLVAALASFAIGFVWYAPPVLGGYWARQVSRYSSIPQDELKATPTLSQLALWLAGMAINALVLALVAEGIGADSVGEGIVLGLVVGIGFGATFFSWPAIFARAPWGWWAVNTAAFLVMQMAMGAILGAW